jgi:hypothetical protein
VDDLRRLGHRGTAKTNRPRCRSSLTIETCRALGALDRLELVVMPLLLGGGMRLTPALSANTNPTLQSECALPGGSVEIVYSL